MPWRPLGRAVATALLIAAAVLLLITVRVDGGSGGAVACGSGWDVVAGRAGWQQWWAQDLADPAGASLPRTARCPGAVNAHIVAAGALAAAAAAAALAAEVVFGRRARDGARGRAAPASRRLRTLGAAVTALGVVLTLAGLAGLALLTADPADPLFLYVSRPVVLLAGLLLLLPAVLLAALGRAATLLAEQLSRGEAPGEPS